MRRLLILAAFVVLALPLLAAEEGCDTTTTNQPDEGTKNQAEQPEKSKKKPKKAKVGDSITIKDQEGAELTVTVLSVTDPIDAGEYDEAPAGARFVGVNVQIVNRSADRTYSDAPSNGAQLITDTDEQATSTIMSSGECGSAFGSSAKIGPGSRQKGCLPFEVREGQQPKTFQFSADSGFGPTTAEWKLS